MTDVWHSRSKVSIVTEADVRRGKTLRPKG